MDDQQAASLAGALSHPLRIAFLRALRRNDTLSPVQFSRESGELLGNVSYHVKSLKAAGVVQVSDSVPRRGAVEHRYSLRGRRSAVALAALDLLSAS
jgi:DNA-binding transcriptional ArsR family regulator